ncbi:uncharacterized protein BDZ99DRAFT_543820 [Mytilinidion resinicola]|uniref:Uncharacterized protein n=1 Tax=Mytilinidion resinicola TaxID=574789 RepID=A0A6A6Y8G4_9PEZI|nr:uncharacterized protein BDZ99DRAFT_543820 [Mytilinidion resinicola]KAF2804899.1 hypothetical protein BDZ99DRAFT_543820 [Mytilinidion resinicola]
MVHRDQDDTLLWSTITSVSFNYPLATLSSFLETDKIEHTKPTVQPSSTVHVFGHGIGQEQTALMCTNKFIAADLYSLLVRNIEVIFNLKLSNRPSYHMRMSHFGFRFMTHVTLTSNIGKDCLRFPGHSIVVVKKWHRLRLAEQTLSLRYLAQYCPSLQVLTFKLSFHDVCHAKLSALDAITRGLRELVRKCEAVEMVKLRYLPWQAMAPASDDAQEENVNPDREDDPGVVWEDGIKRKRLVEDCFSVQKYPMWAREDEISEWSRDVMMDIRRHKSDYGASKSRNGFSRFYF